MHNVRLRAQARLVDHFRQLAQKCEHQWPKVKCLQHSPIKNVRGEDKMDHQIGP